MHEILYKEDLNSEDYLIEVRASLVARKFKPGQFVILRIHERGERIPLTVTDCDPDRGSVSVIVKRVGKTTYELGRLNAGESILDVVGPLGRPSEIEMFGTVACVCGGTGIACIYPIARALKEAGNYIISVLGARTKDLLILEDKVKSVSDELIITTDDGSYGRRGVVTEPLEELIGAKQIDRVITIGPPVMMKFVAQTTEPRGVKTIVSLNPVMVDGTGMCGSCRVFIDGEMKLACIDGPEFDAHKVNFEDVISRLAMFKEKEAEALRVFKGGA